MAVWWLERLAAYMQTTVTRVLREFEYFFGGRSSCGEGPVPRRDTE